MSTRLLFMLYNWLVYRLKQYKCESLVYDSFYWQNTVSIVQMLLQNLCVSAPKFKMWISFKCLLEEEKKNI